MKRILVIVAALVVVAAVAVAGYTRSTERVRTLDYRAYGYKVLVPDTSMCVDLNVKARVRGTTSPSGLLGWRNAGFADPRLQVAIDQCGGDGSDVLERLEVSTTWVARSCRLSAAADAFASAEPASAANSGWQVRSGACNNAAVEKVAVERSGSLAVSGNDVVNFAGRTWDAQLCFQPSVYVNVTIRNQNSNAVKATGVSIRLDPACVKR